MIKLKVFLNGQFQAARELDASATLLVGRGEGCDLVLNPERGISRQHFQIQQVNGAWILKVLSKYGELYREGHKVQQLDLRNGIMFSVPPYDFVFESDEEAHPVSQNSNASVLAPNSDEDRTHIGFVPSAAYFRLVNGSGEVVQTYRLDGTAWVGGRDVGCSIFIDNPRISRRQFEVYKQEEAYFIRDLGSVNTTQVNSRPIPADTWTPLVSMDVISVADWMLHFEMRDAQFEQRLQEIDPGLRAPVIYESPGVAALTGHPHIGVSDLNTASPGVAGIPGNQAPAPQNRWAKLKLKYKLNPVRVAILALVVFGGVYAVFSGPAPEKVDVSKRQTPFEKLPADKQQYVKQAYLAAQAHLAQGNYELARQEIVKIHQVIPMYEDSKQIEAAAARGVEMLGEMEKLQQQEAEKRQIEEKINATLKKCKNEMKPDAEMTWLEACLAPIMEFNPDHPGILDLRTEVERRVQERAMNAATAALYRQNVAKFKAIYMKALTLEKKNLPLDAIRAYGNVVKSGLPDPEKLKGVAKRQIASLTAQVARNQEEYERKADAAFGSERYKEAVQLIRKAVSFNPENEDMKGKQAKFEKELTKSMQLIYQEGILEENVGNVEVAKKKWGLIKEQSLEGEEYFKKARVKLKKYGVE